jgi:U2 small nuclear ribonucleoprotein A'
VIDLSDNDIKKLDNFPLMSRLNALLLNNNSVIRVTPQLGDHLPKLQGLILTNNKVSHLYEIDHIASLKKLDTLSLLENPVALQPNYRAYVIHKIPHLKTLDFMKISKKERDDSKALFASPAGRAFLSNVQQERAIYISSLEQKRASSASQGGSSNASNTSANKAVLSLTDDQRRQVKEAIEKATTKEEIDLIEYQLKVRYFLSSLENNAHQFFYF